ncbi:MAG: carbohydrate ABC transporter permease [Oscillospiraceae bacterium]|jgi:putative aldouronate transport system permease protein|nr:carbohydrate ABC transporter permease [Oscillospiraceae bacterium]
MNKLRLSDYIILAVLLLIGFICLVPILNAIAISLSDKTAAAMGEVVFLPKKFNTSAYEEIVKEGRFFHAFGVSIRRVLLGVSIGTALSVVMAYPLSKSPRVFRQRNAYMWLMVFTMLFNGGLIPTYLVVKNLGLINTIWSLVLPGAVSVYNTIILMNFNKGIPPSLEESALIDGANPLQILVRIYIPLAKASIATIALFTMVYHWNEFFMGKIYINTLDQQPLQTYIQGLSVTLTTQQMASMTPEEIIRKLAVSNVTFNSAKAIVSMIPVIIVYPFLQRFFVTGLVMGAVKE